MELKDGTKKESRIQTQDGRYMTLALNGGYELHVMDTALSNSRYGHYDAVLYKMQEEDSPNSSGKILVSTRFDTNDRTGTQEEIMRQAMSKVCEDAAAKAMHFQQAFDLMIDYSNGNRSVARHDHKDLSTTFGGHYKLSVGENDGTGTWLSLKTDTGAPFENGAMVYAKNPGGGSHMWAISRALVDERCDLDLACEVMTAYDLNHGGEGFKGAITMGKGLAIHQFHEKSKDSEKISFTKRLMSMFGGSKNEPEASDKNMDGPDV